MVDITKFIKAPEYDITIITYRDVFQASICEEDRYGQECQEKSAVILLDPVEMKRMGIGSGSNVSLSSRGKKIIVKAQASPREEQKGIGFMINSPWSNMLVDAETVDGIPEYKRIHARIAVTKENLTGLEDILVKKHTG